MINKPLLRKILANKPIDQKLTNDEVKDVEKVLKKDSPLPRGLRWRVYNTGKISILLTFTHKGIVCREILPKLTHKKDDMNYAISIKGKIYADQARDVFKYADYFPESKNLEKFGEAKSNATLEYYVDKYIDNKRKGNISPSTIEKNINGKKLLGNLLMMQVTDINQKILKEHYLNEKRAVKTCSISFTLLKNALADAKIDEIIEYNPCDGFYYSRYVDNKQKVMNTSDRADPFILEEVIKILESAYSYKRYPQLGAMIQFWLNTGLRTQEIFGLKWENVDIKNKIAHITEGMLRGQAKDTLKNERAKRDVPLNEAALEVLEKQMPLTYFKKGYVFIDERRNIFQDDRKFCQTWKLLLKRAGVRYRRPYNCRHTYATMQISSKNDVNNWELIQWMGHSSLAMLEKHYASFKKTYNIIDSRDGLSLTLPSQIQVQNECIS